MKIVFAKQDPKVVVALIKEHLGGRKLGKMVDFELGTSTNLCVTIKKMGTSELRFTFHDEGKEMAWNLTDEKIALAHRAFRGEVMEKLVKIVGQAGGKVIA